jgi:hypothetical protein
MLRLQLGWLIVFGAGLFLACHAAAPQKVRTLDDNIKHVELTAGSETIGGASMEDAVAFLRHHAAFPVSFEFVEYDRAKDGLTLSTALAKLHQLKQTQTLSDLDEMRLKTYEQQISDGQDSGTVIGFQKRTFSIVEDNISVRAFLERLAVLDGAYSWRNDGTDDAPVVVIQPRGKSALEWNVPAICGSPQDLLFAKLYGSGGKLTVLFQQHNISRVAFQGGVETPDVQVDICKSHLSARDVLNLTAASLGHDVSWTLSGVKGLRWLTFQ